MLFIYLSMISDPQEQQNFADVYSQYKQACLRAALAQTGGNMVLAEDALHNAVAKILTKHPEYLKDSCSKLRAIFVIIVKNEAIDLMRKEARRSHKAFDEFEETTPSEDIPTAEMFAGNETYEEIKACIEELDDIYKLVFVYRYLDHLTNTEIAEKLGISAKHVSVRLVRAKQQLRTLLKERKIANE